MGIVNNQFNFSQGILAFYFFVDTYKLVLLYEEASFTINFLIKRISSDLLVHCGLQAYRHNYLADFRFPQEKLGCMRRPEVTESPDMELSGAAVTLTSASSGGGVHSAALSDRDGCEVLKHFLCLQTTIIKRSYLRSCRMNSNKIVKV